MAQQIKVNSSTGNIQIQISRGAIGPSTTANVANTAYNLDAASTANVKIGGGVANYVLSTDGAGNTSWVAQTGGGATNPAGSNTQVQFNDQGSFGAEPNFTYDKATDVLTADHFSGEGGNLSNIQGANVSGAVANATHATSADSANAVAGANVTGEVAFAATANAVAGANVSGAVANAVYADNAGNASLATIANTAIEAYSVDLANVVGAGNIASINLDGNVANVLRGDGTFSPDTAGTPAGSNTQVQYNNNGAFGAEAGFEYDDVTNTLTVDNITANIAGTVTGDVDGALLVDVYNDTGVTLNKGDAVYLVGPSTGDNPHVAPADADDPTKMPALGVVKENIAPTAVGQVVTSGVMNDSSHGYTLGADLYVSTTPGQLTETIPTGESEGIQKIGKVVNANQIIVQGAFRTNATPNLDEGNIFIGNATNQATTANLYGEINTHLAAFGSNTITTTGNVETGNLTATSSLLVQGTGANTTTIAPDLTSIGSAQFTQVSTIEEKTVNTGGSFIIGKPYTIETTGTTDFTQVGAGSQVLAPNIQQFNTYTIISQGTSDFTLIGAPDNNVGTTFTANANGTPGTGVVGEFEPGTQFTATGVGSGTGTASYKNPFLIGYMTEDYDGEGRLDNAVYARTTSGNIAKGASFGFISYDTVGNANTDPLVASQVQFTANPTAADLATAGTGTVTTMTMGGPGADGFLTVIGAGASPNVYLGGAWKQFQYRDISMDFVRRNGNADARLSTVADDETSLNFYNTQDLGGGSVTGSTYNYPARMGSKVDPGWVDPQNGALGIENGLFFEVVNDFFDRTQHRMYSNGTVEFNQSSIDYLGNPVSTNPVTIGTNGIITADGGNISNIAVANVNGLGNIATVNLDGNTANYLNGTGSWAPVTASPGGFFDTIQFNNGGTLDGNSSFQFIPGSNPEVQLNGTASSSDVGILRLQNSILDLYTEDMSGGYTPMSFSTYNSGGFIDPINYYRARGTRSTPAAVIAGDTVKNQRNQVYSGPTATLAFAGGETTTVQANDGTGNIAVTTTISTARPANGPTSLDKILLDTEFVQTAGNIQMNNTDARFTAGRIAQVVHIFANLPASPVQGERAMISDGPAYNTFGTVVTAGGGSNYMPLFWDGGNWRMG